MLDDRAVYCLPLLTLVMLPFAMAQTVPPSTQPVTLSPDSRPDAWWQDRHAAVLKRVQQGGVDLIFIGDSITQGWEEPGRAAWDKHFAPRRAVDLGFSGDGTQHVLWRLDNGEIDGIEPRLAVVMIGTNNAATCSAEHIAAGVEAVVGRLRSKLPKTKVLLLGIFPRSQKSDALRERVAATNVLLARHFGAAAGDPLVRYVDIASAFLSRDGTISPEIMPDFLHLSPQAYQRWADAIEPHVAELMK